MPVRAYLYDADGTDHEISLVGGPAEHLTDRQLLWVDVLAQDEHVRGDSQLAQLDAPSFFAALLDWHVTGYFRVVEQFEAEVDCLEELALTARSQDNLLARLVVARRRVAAIRRALAPHREVYASLARPDFPVLASSESAAHFHALNERLERAIDAVENARDLVIGSFEIFSTHTAQRTTSVIKVLTLVWALLLPATVITSLMRMNFHATVYRAGDAGFWSVVALILLVDVIALAIVRRRKLLS